MSQWFNPKSIIGVGLVAVVGGAALIVVIPAVLTSFIRGETQIGQETQATIEIALRILGSFLPPLGAALVGAGVVMAYVDKKIGGPA